MKFLPYEASLSFLKGAASGNADQILREEVQTTVDHCIASMTTDSVVGAVVECLECRKTVLELSNRLELANHPDLRIAMRADEEQIATFLVSIFSSQSDKETVLRLEGDSAQHFMDVVQEVVCLFILENPKSCLTHLPQMLDRGFLMKQEHTRMAFRIIRKLSESRDMLPTSLYIVGVHDREEHPSFGGGFADVYSASYRNQPVALKCMRLLFHGSDLRRIRLKFCREALIWKDLHHPNILPFLGIDRDSFPSSLCMVSPLMDHGTVMNYLETHGHANVDKLLYEIVQGLEYLHSHSVVHGNLQGTNILIKQDRSACLAGFGFITLSDGITPMSSNRGVSLYWMAPELLNPERFGLNFARTPATDVYAFGCVCIELYTGKPPFSAWPEATVFMKVLNGERPKRPSGPPTMPDLLWQYITQSWAESPTTRPSTTRLAENLAALISGPQTSPATTLPPGTRSAPPAPTPIIGPETAQTTSNVLELALRALSSLSNHIPVARILGAIIDSLLEIAGHIEQTLVDAQGFNQLATQIERLPPIVEQMAESNPDGGRRAREAN
ncbi:kinase-like domain-containing protein [Mycena galopus ATCC 62051]|nr:kinase-like domain-containing protein [Mycena galopus ATCC 62051]